MARNEADREDLMREAVALTERVELFVPGFEELITIGFRSNGAMSIFVGQDPVYQFDPSGRLRRAFADRQRRFVNPRTSEALTCRRLHRGHRQPKPVLRQRRLLSSISQESSAASSATMR